MPQTPPHTTPTILLPKSSLFECPGVHMCFHCWDHFAYTPPNPLGIATSCFYILVESLQDIIDSKHILPTTFLEKHSISTATDSVHTIKLIFMLCSSTLLLAWSGAHHMYPYFLERLTMHFLKWTGGVYLIYKVHKLISLPTSLKQPTSPRMTMVWLQEKID